MRVRKPDDSTTIPAIQPPPGEERNRSPGDAQSDPRLPSARSFRCRIAHRASVRRDRSRRETRPGEIVPLTIECHLAYRAAVTVPIELEQTLELSSAETARTADLGDLRFGATYFNGEFSGEGRFLKVSVLSIEDDREVTSQLYQLSKTEPPKNEFHGGHGFTGLSYAYHPSSSSELQYWCVGG